MRGKVPHVRTKYEHTIIRYCQLARACGIALLASRAFRRRRKTTNSIFIINSIPGYLGMDLEMKPINENSDP